jgi:site-specific recombinase XerC
MTDEFGLYLRHERALAATTGTTYQAFVGRFLHDRCAEGQVALAALGAADVSGFVQRQAVRLPPKQAQLMTTALRSFLQYARSRGDLHLDLAAAVPTVAQWAMASLPRALPSEHVERILGQCNRQTAIGRRDYALLLLLARLGLRAGEVVTLRLEDIDWDTGGITVRGKGGQWSQRPLSLAVGEALATY